MTISTIRKATLPVLVAVALALPLHAQEGEHASKEDYVAPTKDYSPNLDQSFPNRVLWGDTHLHTSYSVDAGMVGCRLGPEDAYRFARGEEVKSNTGQRVKLARPLDFLAVTDHAENLGLAPMIATSDPLV